MAARPHLEMLQNVPRKDREADPQVEARVDVDYLALASSCRTVNQFNRLHIDLENTLAPLDVARISRIADLPNASIDWLKRLRRRSPRMLRSPQPYERRQLNNHVTIYEAPGSCGELKSLLIAFCGNSGRLMMPIPMFLQLFEAADWNVALAGRAVRSSYPRRRDWRVERLLRICRVPQTRDV